MSTKHTTPDATIYTENLDEIPLVLGLLQQMGVASAVDQALGAPHPNWKGLSFGTMAVVFVAAVIHRQDHHLYPLEDWTRAHQRLLTHALEQEIQPAAMNDDRMAILLGRLGANPEVSAQVEQTLGARMLRAYHLPTATARLDFTTISVHHEQVAESSLLQFGKSKDNPSLRQFKVGLGTLDPLGVPLVSATLPGNAADDVHYVPLWDRMVETIGHADFLTVGDCKLASKSNRAHIAACGGMYLAPLPMTGKVPKELRDWVLDPAHRTKPLTRRDEDEERHEVGRAFEIEVAMRGRDKVSGKKVKWTERRLLMQSDSHAEAERAAFERKIEKVRQELKGWKVTEQDDVNTLQKKAEILVRERGLEKFLQAVCIPYKKREKRYEKPGRPGPHSPFQWVESTTYFLGATEKEKAVAEARLLFGWRQYATNAPKTRLTQQQALDEYRDEYLVERGFSRLKGGVVGVLPVYIQDEARIAGLVLLLAVALRVVTLLEFVVRRALFDEEKSEPLAGLFPGQPKRTTRRPTAERIFQVIELASLTLTIVHRAGEVLYHVTPLPPALARIVEFLGFSRSIYAISPLAKNGVLLS